MRKSQLRVLAAVLVTSLCGCSSQDSKTNTLMGNAGSGYAGDGASAGNGAGAGNGAAGSSQSSAGAGGSSSAGTGASAGSGGGAGSGASAGTSGAGTSGGAGSGAGAGGTGGGDKLPLVDCKSGPEALMSACGTFTTDLGAKLMLGPYGAATDKNVGKGFEVAIASGDSDMNAQCKTFAGIFNQDAATTAKLLDTMDLNFALYSVYRPANWVEGEKYPLITWGNGTCAQPEGYGALLRYVASYGFVIVASNSRWVGNGASPMTKALDFMQAANEDSTSPYYHRLDLDKIGAMGHSQGGMATATAASDMRIKSVILWNGGTTASKEFLSVSGDRDIFSSSSSQLKTDVDKAPKAAYIFYHMIPMTGTYDGHLVLMMNPERVVEPAVAWLKMTLLNDKPSADYFVGASCKLCGHSAEYEFGEHGL